MTQDGIAELVEHGHWTESSLSEAWQTPKRGGSADLPPGTPRDLNAQERLHVTIGQYDSGHRPFLFHALGEETPNVLRFDLISLESEL